MMKQDARTRRFRLATVAAMVATVLFSGLDPVASAASKTTRKVVKTTKRSVVTRRTTTKAVLPTTAAPTTAAPTTVAATTVAPTTVTTVATTVATVPPTTVQPVAFSTPIQTVYLPLGGTVTFPVWLTVRAGFNELVTLVPVDLPAGVSMSFEQNPIRNYTVASITVREGTGVLPLVTVEGRSASFTARMKLVINVTGTATGGGTTTTLPSTVSGRATSASGAFSITYNQPSTALKVLGEVGSYRLGIERRAGVTGDVTFTIAAALPKGMVANFDKTTASGNEGFLFVGAYTGAEVGVVPVAVSATLGGETVVFVVVARVA